MDIFNRPPTISEDTLQYALYPLEGSNNNSSLSVLAASIQAYVQTLLPNFIWHRDSFELKVAQNSDGDKELRFLEGIMRVGDSVDDEWCVVWLLREISAKWDLAIRVWDSDGEFLLIEAADHLPSWVSPANADRRVWLYRSRLHLIPLSFTSPPPTARTVQPLFGGGEHEGEEDLGEENYEDYLSVNDALRVLQQYPEDTCALGAVQNAVWGRISGYPRFAEEHLHTCNAYIPIDIAKALSEEPFLVQKAVETFYTRDAVQLRAAQKMSKFPPNTSVLASVTMTRTAYAQLLGQKFHPPKIFGRFSEAEGNAQRRWKDIGMKIACGFEMLYQENKPRSGDLASISTPSSIEARNDTLRRNPDYLKYIEGLKRASYFKDETEGSQLWKELENKADEVFISVRRTDDASRPTFAVLVNNAISKAADKPLPSPQQTESSDAWLNIDAESLDAKLTQTLQTSTEGKASDTMDVDDAEEQLNNVQAAKLKNLADKINNFVNDEGTLEGATFEDDPQSDGEELSEFSDEKFSSDEESEEEDKDTRQEAMDKLVAGIDPADYGKMPDSYYQNSAKTQQDVSSSENAVSDLAEAKPEVGPKPKPIRRPVFVKDNFDGVDSDDTTDEEEEMDEEEDEEDKPQVVGDIEIDMENEADDFLRFTREVLGISESQWGDILTDRRNRGVFVPTEQEILKEEPMPPSDFKPEPPSQKTAPVNDPPHRNPNLDSFEAVMQAMDDELAKSKLAKTKQQQTQSKSSTPLKLKQTQLPANTAASSAKSKGKMKVPVIPEDEEDDDGYSDVEAMHAELKQNLARDPDADGSDDENEEMMDYGLMKNFLESFKSQAGLSGPVGSLVGRLEPNWSLPRDESG